MDCILNQFVLAIKLPTIHLFTLIRDRSGKMARMGAEIRTKVVPEAKVAVKARVAVKEKLGIGVQEKAQKKELMSYRS